MDTLSYKTVSANKETVNKEWLLVDADGETLGRLASKVARLIRGKHKVNFTPHVDCGDNVIVVNAEKVKLTGNKWEAKEYIRHTGYPGGIKETTPEKLSEKKPGEVLKLAVKRMLPSGALGKKQLSKLKIYSGENHPHSAQNPKIIEIGKLNEKNIVRN